MKKSTLSILIVLLIVFSGTAFYFYKKSLTLESSPEAYAQKEADLILSKVSSLILLPQDELPTIATINSLEGLKDQLFFAKAKVGDKVIMYQKAKRAYLYDEVNNKILEVAPIVFGESEEQ